MIKKIVVCDKCHEAEAKYYTGERVDAVYCEKCIMEVMNARRADCLLCYHCEKVIQNTGHIVRQGRHYCSVECLAKHFYCVSSAGKLNDTDKELLIANG